MQTTRLQHAALRFGAYLRTGTVMTFTRMALTIFAISLNIPDAQLTTGKTSTTISFSSHAYAAPSKKDKPKVVKATDGNSEVTLLEGWSKLEDLHDKAELQIGSPAQDLYLIVLTESKQDFVQMNLAEYSKTAIENITSSISEPEVSKVKKAFINGHKGLRHEIKGAYENMRVVYILIAIEGKQHYHQVLAWTLSSKFDSLKPVLEKAIGKFKESEKSK